MRIVLPATVHVYVKYIADTLHVHARRIPIGGRVEIRRLDAVADRRNNYWLVWYFPKTAARNSIADDSPNAGSTLGKIAREQSTWCLWTQCYKIRPSTSSHTFEALEQIFFGLVQTEQNSSRAVPEEKQHYIHSSLAVPGLLPWCLWAQCYKVMPPHVIRGRKLDKTAHEK